MKKAPQNVDAYIETAPRKVRAKLVQLRRIIKAAAPEADERISYGMPYYEYRGRRLTLRLSKNILDFMCPLQL